MCRVEPHSGSGTHLLLMGDLEGTGGGFQPGGDMPLGGMTPEPPDPLNLSPALWWMISWGPIEFCLPDASALAMGS